MVFLEVNFTFPTDQRIFSQRTRELIHPRSAVVIKSILCILYILLFRYNAITDYIKKWADVQLQSNFKYYFFHFNIAVFFYCLQVDSFLILTKVRNFW